ncbi:hypothetical protein P8452_39297 [Trifolium repens]|nr:hypothetical protein P8452_39297 [Trifolium repens]
MSTVVVSPYNLFLPSILSWSSKFHLQYGQFVKNSDAAAFYGGSEFHFEMEIDWTFQVDRCSFPLGEGCTTIDIEFLELQARDTLQNICTGPISNAKYMLVYKVEI